MNGGKVECQIFGVPKPKVVWYKDFHPLKETFRVQAYHYPPDVYTLFIEDYITRVSCQLPMVKWCQLTAPFVPRMRAFTRWWPPTAAVPSRTLLSSAYWRTSRSTSG